MPVAARLGGVAMFLGGYWSARAESPDSAADRLSRFLLFLASERDDLKTWYFLGKSKKDALRRRLESFDPSSILPHLKWNRKDVGREIIRDLGLSFSVWNDEEISLSAHVGCYTETVGFTQNNVILNLHRVRDELTCAQQRAILEAMIREFDPEHAVATSHEVLDKAGARRPWGAGWLLYERGGSLREI